MAELTWTLLEVKQKMRSWSLRKLDRHIFGKILDAEWLDVFNQVASDLNRAAELRIERYNKKTTSGETNYEMQGVILHVLRFLYKHDSKWLDQRYATVDDVIVLKDDPASNDVEIDIVYLRDTEKLASIDDDVSEIDLPGFALFAYLDLVKTKVLEDFGDVPDMTYETKLMAKSAELRMMRGNTAVDSIESAGHWLYPDNDDRKYDITDQIVSRDSVAALGDGDYEIVE